MADQSKWMKLLRLSDHTTLLKVAAALDLGRVHPDVTQPEEDKVLPLFLCGLFLPTHVLPPSFVLFMTSMREIDDMVQVTHEGKAVIRTRPHSHLRELLSDK